MVVFVVFDFLFRFYECCQVLERTAEIVDASFGNRGAEKIVGFSLVFSFSPLSD